MSAINFFLGRGSSPIVKTKSITGADTVAVWTPITGKRVIVTDLTIMGGPESGTISFFFADKQNPVAQIASYGAIASINFSPSIGCWESTAVGGAIFARKSTTLGEMFVNLTGFEVE